MLISGCSNIKQIDASALTSSISQTRQLATLTHFELSGAIAIKHARKGWAASLSWQQKSNNTYQIRLFGPFGANGMLIEKINNTITLQTNSHKLVAPDAETLIEYETGMRLPVNHLYYWIRGLPAPIPIDHKTYNERNDLRALSQAGYEIVYTDYMRVGDLYLPKKIHLDGHGISIRCVIKQWRIE
jgi:outer membrane lipoprotein LolB